MMPDVKSIRSLITTIIILRMLTSLRNNVISKDFIQVLDIALNG